MKISVSPPSQTTRGTKEDTAGSCCSILVGARKWLMPRALPSRRRRRDHNVDALKKKCTGSLNRGHGRCLLMRLLMTPKEKILELEGAIAALRAEHSIRAQKVDTASQSNTKGTEEQNQEGSSN